MKPEGIYICLFTTQHVPLKCRPWWDGDRLRLGRFSSLLPGRLVGAGKEVTLDISKTFCVLKHGKLGNPGGLNGGFNGENYRTNMTSLGNFPASHVWWNQRVHIFSFSSCFFPSSWFSLLTYSHFFFWRPWDLCNIMWYPFLCWRNTWLSLGKMRGSVTVWWGYPGPHMICTVVMKHGDTSTWSCKIFKAHQCHTLWLWLT